MLVTLFSSNIRCHMIMTREPPTSQKTSQNDLLDYMGHAILKAIVKEVLVSRYYSILADEVMMFQAWNKLRSPYGLLKMGRQLRSL